MPFGFRDGGGDLADRVAEGARPRGRRTDRSGRRGGGRLGGGSTRRRRLPRRQLRALRILPRRRSCELRKPGLHWSAAERRLCRGDDREGEQPDGRAGRALIGRCRALAMRRPNDLQRVARFAGKGGRLGRGAWGRRAGSPWRAIRSPHGLRGDRDRSRRRRQGRAGEEIGCAPLRRQRRHGYRQGAPGAWWRAGGVGHRLGR